ncbi:hypothetical protein KI387_015436, partial [Taxus chinensis]
RCSVAGTEKEEGNIMARAVGRTLGGPLLILNFIMYVIVLGFAGWTLNKFINQQNHPYLAGNTATMYFLIFSLIAGVVGAASTLSGSYHLRAWRSDSLAAAASSALIAWVLTVLAFGLACKEIHIGHRGRSLKTLEAFIIILTFTQLAYLLLLHAGLVSSKYGPGYRDSAYGGTATDSQMKPTAPVV